MSKTEADRFREVNTMPQIKRQEFDFYNKQVNIIITEVLTKNFPS